MGKRPETGKPIPNDWDGESYSMYMLCAPDSQMWHGYVMGAIRGLTYGWDWDARTGSITDTQAIAQEIYDSMAKCNDLIKTNRMLVAAIVGENVDLTDPAQLSPDNVDYTQSGLIPNLNKYLIHLEALGAIPGDGDTIQDSLIKLVDASGWDDRTIDELIAEIAGLGSGTLDTLADLANLLIAYKAIFPGTTRVTVAHSFYEKLQSKRYWHNHLSLEAYQATALRGIQRALTPFDENQAEDHEGDVLNKIFSIPFLAKALVAVVEPTPAGEVTVAGSLLSGIVKDAYEIIRSAWNLWWEKWINRVETPVPVDTVTGSLSAIADAIAKISPANQGEIDNSSIPAAITALAAVLGVEGAALVAALENIGGTIAPAIEGLELSPTINVDCSKCGSSGGCGCGDVPSQPASETDPPPVGWEEPTDDEGTPVGPGDPVYNDRKCKVSNIIHFQIVEIVTSIQDNATLQTMLPSSPSYVGGSFISAALVTVLNAVLGALSFVIGNIGDAAKLAFSLLNVDVNLSGLLLALSDNEEDLICALYSSSNSLDAVYDYSQILNDAGINGPTRAVVEAILVYDLVNMIFFKNSGLSLAIEDVISTYDPPIPCNCDCEHAYAYGVVVSDDPGILVLQSVNQDGAHRANVTFCNQLQFVTLNSVVVSTGSVTTNGLSIAVWRIASSAGNIASGWVGDLYNGNTPPAGYPYNDVKALAITSGSAFTITINYTLEV